MRYTYYMPGDHMCLLFMCALSRPTNPNYVTTETAEPARAWLTFVASLSNSAEISSYSDSCTRCKQIKIMPS